MTFSLFLNDIGNEHYIGNDRNNAAFLPQKYCHNSVLQ